MQSVRDVIAHVAGDNVTVLLLGETSVGKEGVAHALHLAPPRASHPFLKVNCAALPEDLLESELFRLQAKLLHVLQDGEFARVGGDSIIQSDVRVIAATTRDLESAIESGRFREDLYLSSQRDRHPRPTVTRTARRDPDTGGLLPAPVQRRVRTLRRDVGPRQCARSPTTRGPGTFVSSRMR